MGDIFDDYDYGTVYTIRERGKVERAISQNPANTITHNRRLLPLLAHSSDDTKSSTGHTDGHGDEGDQGGYESGPHLQAESGMASTWSLCGSDYHAMRCHFGAKRCLG